jgi:hypothetical protein
VIVLRTESDVAYESSAEPVRLGSLPGYLRGSETGDCHLVPRLGQE